MAHSKNGTKESLRSVPGVVRLLIAAQFFIGLIVFGISAGGSPAFPTESNPTAACNNATGPHAGSPNSARELRNRVAGRMTIIAHRGYSSTYRENSLEAFKEAIAGGVDIVEADVRESLDRVLVVSHAEVEEETAHALKQQGIIPLEPLLELAKGRVLVLLDMKNENSPIFGEVLQIIDKYNMEDQIIFALRSVEQTRELRKLNSGMVVVGFLPRRSYEFASFFEAGGDIARLWEGDIDPVLVKEARGDSGARPIWITPRSFPHSTGHIDDRRLRKLMEAGFDGVLVNDPKAAHETRCAHLRAASNRRAR